MEMVGIKREERAGLVVAVVLHLALLAMLIVQGLFPAPAITPPERMTVSLAEDVGMEATAPEPVSESRASVAPELSEMPTPPQEVIPSRSSETSTTSEAAAPSASSQGTRPMRQIMRPKPAPPSAPRRTEQSGGSRLGDNFLEGSGASTSTSETRAPASQIGASTKASLVQAIARRIKPRWEPPNGPEVEKITTFLRFRLNADGSLAGRPEMVRQTGINDTNRAQAGRHAEQAIRAVQLAAPFDDLPAEYYEAWKLVGPFSFDWRLAQ